MSALLLSLLSFALAAPPDGAPCQGGEHRGGPHGGPPSMAAMVMHVVEDVDLDDATRQAVEDLADAGRDTLDADHEAVRAAHDALRATLDTDVPSRAKVLAASAALDKAQARMRADELSLMVDLATTLGPDAWAAVRAELPDGPPRGEGHEGGRGGRGPYGGAGPDADPGTCDGQGPHGR